MRHTLITLSALFTTLHALTITSPTPGSTVDPSQPIVVRWTSTTTDPAVFNLVFGEKGQVASNVQTSSGSYTIPANTVTTYGAGYSIAAVSTTGGNLASTGNFALGYGSNQVVTLGNGQLSLVSGGAAASTSLSSIVFNTSGLEGQSVTATYLPSTDISATVPAGSTITGTLSSITFSTNGVTGSVTIASSTRNSASASSSTSSSTSASATAAATTNAQPRIGATKEVMGAAGLLAGLVALVA